MKIFQNRIFIGGLCIVLAAVVAFVVVPSLNNNKGKTRKIIKLKDDIVSGTKINEEMITETEVGSYGLPDNIITNKNDIVGKYSNCDIKSEDLVMSSKLSEFAADERLDKIHSNGQKLVTVTVPSLAAGVGNHIRAGDYVSVFLYEDGFVEVIDELKNIEIYSVENSEAQDIEHTDDDADAVAATLTLIVNDVQAQKLIYTEYSGKLHIVFERRGGN